MRRRPDRAVLALALPILLFVAFGMVRVTAPVSALGVVFEQPLGFAVVAAVVSVGGALLLFIRPVELAAARALVGPSRPPSDSEEMRLGGLLTRVGDRAGVDTARLVVRIQDDTGVNASAGAAHLLFVTKGALALSDEELEAIIAHELGHHRGMHPVQGAIVWWLRLPGAALAGVFHLLRRAVGALGQRLGRLGRVLAVPLLVLMLVWQATVMWVFYLGELLAMRATRISEYEADDAAAKWGYAGRLATAYERLARRETEPAGRWARLMADHPPLQARIERLERTGEGAAAEPAVGVHP